MSLRVDLGPKPRLSYVDSRVERAAERRAGGIAALAAAPGAAAYVIGGERVLLNKAASLHDPLFPLDQARTFAPVIETVFLGLASGAPRFGVGIAPEAAEALKERGDIAVSGLRTIAMHGLVAGEHLPPIAEAKAVLHWHLRHRYCANCGALTQAMQAGWRRDCAQCGAQHFPRTDPVVIMLATRGECCLLGRSPRFAPSMWSCLAGFVEPGESIEEAVRRETLEEAGIATGLVGYFASQPWPFPMSLMIGCHAEALSETITIDRAELEDARWFTRDEVASMALGRHPDGLRLPATVAIAYHIIRAWLDGEGAFA